MLVLKINSLRTTHIQLGHYMKSGERVGSTSMPNITQPIMKEVMIFDLRPRKSGLFLLICIISGYNIKTVTTQEKPNAERNY